jgi:hypothetical protein
LVVGNGEQRGVLQWRAGQGWSRSSAQLPEGTSVVNAQGRDAGLRFVDVDGDSHADIVFSDADRYSVDLYVPSVGSWSKRVLQGERSDASEIPPFVRADGTNNGAWFKHDHMFVQNEETAGREGQVIRRQLVDLLGDDHQPPPGTPRESHASFDPP